MLSLGENTTGRKDHLSQGASVSVYDSLIAGSISGAVARYVEKKRLSHLCKLIMSSY